MRALLKVALRGPGKGLLLASAAGWIALAWLLTGGAVPHSIVALGHDEHAVAPMAMPKAQFTTMWLAMVLAMAPPLLLREIGRLWSASLHRLRHLTVACFLVGYVGIWLLAGIVCSALFGWVIVSFERVAVAMTLVVIWHCSPARQRCLNACHRMPTLRVFGTLAQLDALRYGLSTGFYCALGCGPVMLLVLLTMDHHLAVMGATAAFTTFERYLPARPPGWQFPLSSRGIVGLTPFGYSDAQ